MLARCSHEAPCWYFECPLNKQIDKNCAIIFSITSAHSPSFAHTHTHTQAHLPLALYQRRQSQVDGATDRLPYFALHSGVVCQACHASPNQLTCEYIYATSGSFDSHHAKSCPSRGEESTASAVAIPCHYQALSTNKSIKPSRVLARPDPAPGQLLEGAAAGERNKVNWALANDMVRASIGDRRPKQGMDGRGSVASLEADEPGGFRHHSVWLKPLGITQFLSDCVSDMDTFVSLFAKPGASPLSKGASLDNREQRVVDAVSTLLADVNKCLNGKDDSTAALRDAISEKDSDKSTQGLFKAIDGIQKYANSSALLALGVVRRADFDKRQKEKGSQAVGEPSEWEVKEEAMFSKLPPFPAAVMAAAECVRAAVVALPPVEAAIAESDDGRLAREQADAVLVPLVHALFVQIFHRHLQPDEGCPVRAHTVAQLWRRHGGGFVEVSSMSSKIIHVKYLARATTFHLITSTPTLTMEERDDLLKYVRYKAESTLTTPYYKLADTTNHMFKISAQAANKIKVIPLGKEGYGVNGKEIWMPAVRTGLHSARVSLAKLFVGGIAKAVPADLFKKFRCASFLGIPGAQPYAVKEDISGRGHDMGEFFACQEGIPALAAEVTYHVLTSLQHHVDGKDELSPSKAREWIIACDSFIRIIVWIIYVVAGHACRGTEAMAFMLRETQLGGRSLFVFQDVIMLIEGYIKQTTMTGKAGEGARFLDPVTSAFLMDFLALFRTLYDNVAKALYKEADGNALFVEAGLPYSHHAILSAIKEGFATFAGLKGVGVQEWRQAAETFVRDDMGRFVEDEFQLASLHEHFHRMLATAKGEAYVGARMAHDMQVQRVILLRVHVSPPLALVHNTYASFSFPSLHLTTHRPTTQLVQPTQSTATRAAA